MKTRIKRKVSYHMCDQNKNLRPDALIKYFMEASSQNTLEFAPEYSELPWVLYRWYIEIDDEIKKDDEIEIETSVRKNRGFFVYRNFYIYKNNKVVVKSESVWLLLDEKLEKIKKIPQQIIEKYGVTEGYQSPKKETKKLDNYEESKKIFIRKSDIDQNNHVTNSAYLEYMDEVRELSQKIKTIEIIYKKQIFYDDKIEIEYTNNSDKLNFIIKREKDIATIGEISFI